MSGRKTVHRRSFVVHRGWGLTALQAASGSDAAARQQIQRNNIASSDPRLVEKAVVRGSWFVKSLPLYPDGL